MKTLSSFLPPPQPSHPNSVCTITIVTIIQLPGCGTLEYISLVYMSFFALLVKFLVKSVKFVPDFHTRQVDQ